MTKPDNKLIGFHSVVRTGVFVGTGAAVGATTGASVGSEVHSAIGASPPQQVNPVNASHSSAMRISPSSRSSAKALISS